MQSGEEKIESAVKNQAVNAIKNTGLKILCAQNNLSRNPFPTLWIIKTNRSICSSTQHSRDLTVTHQLYYAHTSKCIKIQGTLFTSYLDWRTCQHAVHCQPNLFLHHYAARERSGWMNIWLSFVRWDDCWIYIAIVHFVSGTLLWCHKQFCSHASPGIPSEEAIVPGFGFYWFAFWIGGTA